jgi:hypothetical protein
MKFLLKIILFPVTIILTVFVGICRLLNQLSNMVFMLAALLILLIGLATILLAHDMSNGLILIAIAFLISPFGLPLIVTFLIEVLGLFKDMIKAI